MISGKQVPEIKKCLQVGSLLPKSYETVLATAAPAVLQAFRMIKVLTRTLGDLTKDLTPVV